GGNAGSNGGSGISGNNSGYPDGAGSFGGGGGGSYGANGGGGGAVVNLNGVDIGGTGGVNGTGGGGAGASGNAISSGALTTNASYGFVGIGGGGGGGSYNNGGGAGTAGDLTVSGGATLAVNRSMLVGGAGGGAGGYAVGGGGGAGTLSLIRANLSVTETLLIGGSGGGGGYNGTGVGGAGGTGTVTVNQSAITIGSNGSLILGGDNGQSGATTLGGTGGSGTFNFGGGSSLSFGTGASFIIRSNGTLNIGNATINGATGGTVSGLSVLANNGTINFNQTDAFTLSANISGSGSVNQNGSGTATLSGNNTYSGGTNITGGLINFTSLANFGSGNIALNGGGLQWAVGNTTDISGRLNALGAAGGVFDTNGNNVTFANAIGGAGNLIKQGLGTLALTGNNNYVGGTTITGGLVNFSSLANFGSGNIALNGGGLQWAVGNTTDISGRLNALGAAGGVFDTNGNNVTFANAIGGAGNLVKQGSGTLTITGNNAWSGNTTVSAGTLALGSYTQTAGQTLTIGSSSNTNYGKLAVTGAASFNPGANLAVNVAGLNTLAAGQTLRGVVTAGTLTASTFNITDNSALFNFNAVLNGNIIDLNIISANSIAGAVNAAGLKPAIGAARVLDTQVNGTPTGDMTNVVTALGRLSDLPSVVRAADQTLPQNFGTAALSGTLSSLNRLFSGRFASGGQTGLSSGDAMTNRQVWLMPFGSRASQDDRDGASGFSANTWGLAAGIEADLDNLRLGLAYAYGNTNVIGNTALSGAGSHAKIDSNVLALYGSLPFSDLTLGFQVDTGWNSSRSNRDLNFGGLNRTASADYGTWSAHAGASLAKAVPLTAATTLIPALRLDYTRLQSQSYTESGAGALNLTVAAKTTEALVLGVESRLVHALDAQSQLSAHLGAGYDAINDRGDLVAAYAGAPGQGFTASGIEHSPWIIKAGIGYTHKTAQGTDVSLRYDAEGRSGFINQSASVKATWRF
uniref:autotransporter outer membrane beta-barrel domain-containing protein n=1 Tax=Herbaspirillum sp. TaxID=1890675 RepID=UPI0031DF1972